MKSFIKHPMAALVAIGLCLSACAGRTTHFSGKIIGPVSDYNAFFLQDPKSGEYYEIMVPVNPDGTFDTEFELRRNEYHAAFFVDRAMFCTVIEQGKSYYAEFDVTQEGVETNFTFRGEGAAENEFSKKYWNGIGVPGGFLETVTEVGNYADYQQGVNESLDKCVEEVRATGNRKFISYYNNDIESKRTAYNIYYPFLYLAINGSIPEDETFAKYVANDPLRLESDSLTVENINRISAFLILKGTKTDMLSTLRIISGISPDKWVRDVMMTSIMANYLQTYGAENLKEAYEYYSECVTEPAFSNQISEPYKLASVICKGAEAADIEIKDTKGNTLWLSDLKGKALYIDFWASWCKPCCDEIPYLQKLVNDLGKDTELEVISISLDENDDDWHTALKNENPSWKQYIASKEGLKTISRVYGINSIPRFMLLDSKGCIITANAERPSGLSAEKLKEMIK